MPVTGKVLNAYGWDQSQMAAQFQDGLWIATEPEEKICAAYSGTVTGLQEQNGLYTYGRKPKFDPEIFRKILSRKAAIED